MIPTLRADHLAEAEQRLYALADNRIAEQSTWDERKRAEELRDLRLEVPDLDLTLSGFESPTIEFAIAGLDQTNWSDLDDIREDPPVEPITRLGDVFDFDDGYILACGDSTKPDMVEIVANGQTFDFLASDVLYNMEDREYSGKGRHKHGNFVMGAGEFDQEGFRSFLASSLQTAIPHLKDGALAYNFIDGKHVADMIEATARAGLS